MRQIISRGSTVSACREEWSSSNKGGLNGESHTWDSGTELLWQENGWQKHERNEPRNPPIGTKAQVCGTQWDGQRDRGNLGLGMGYQPNDFVNPNQRGAELPPGCKDLMDVLKLEASQRPGWKSEMVWYGALSEVEQHVRGFLVPGAGGQVLFVGIPKRGIVLILAKRGGGALTLNFSVPAKKQSMMDVVRRIFGEPKIGKNVFGKEYVSVAFDPKKDAVGTMMMKLLVEGFGVLEEEQLMFYSYGGVEGTGE